MSSRAESLFRGKPPLDLRAAVAWLPLVLFVGLLAYLWLKAQSFLRPATLALILKQSTPTAVTCLGLSTVAMAGGDDVVSGGIDLSIPSTAVLAGAILADQLTNRGTPIALALLLALSAAVLAGLLNAFLVVTVGMTPLLATLASAGAYLGLAKVITTSRRIDVSHPLIVALRDGRLLGVPTGVVVAAVLFLVLFHALHRTRWGIHLQAVGGSRDAAEISGLSPRRLVAHSFVLAGSLGGVASLFLLARGSGSTPGAEETLLLETVLATFLGAAFSPRRVVTLWGAVLGAVLVSALSVGFGSVGVDVFWTGCIKGGLILLVVASSALSRSARP